MAVEGRTHRPIVDHEKCAVCAVCVRGCPAELILEQRAEPDSLRGHVYRQLYGEKRAELIVSPDNCLDMPPCQANCPIHQDARGYLRLIAARRYSEAMELIRVANALPSVCGYVCHRPCEEACVRRLVDQPVRIRDLKRYVAGLNDGEPPPPKVRPATGKKVAIVGSGPAGLAAAYDLAREGFQVEILEALPEPGGMLRWAIPSFRLPRHILARDIGHIADTGVAIVTGVRFGVDVSLSDLRERGAAAVILATGTHEGLKQRLKNDRRAGGYVDCLGFLRRYAGGEQIDLGGKTVVLGAGNAGIDSARSALRCGAIEVTVVARRSVEDVAVDRGELEQAQAEGVKIMYSTLAVRLVEKRRGIRQVECVRTEPGEVDSSGRRRPVPIAGSEFRIDATSVISATGQRPDLSWNKEGLPFVLSPQKTFVVDDRGLTNVEGVFAAGDAVNGSTTVVEAMGSGRKVARSVALYLSEVQR